jgi:hypothetical protein
VRKCQISLRLTRACVSGVQSQSNNAAHNCEQRNRSDFSAAHVAILGRKSADRL